MPERVAPSIEEFINGLNSRFTAGIETDRSNKQLTTEQARAQKLIDEVRANAHDLLIQAAIVERFYVDGFLRDFQAANEVIRTIAEGKLRTLSLDTSSLLAVNETPATLEQYLSGFVPLDREAEYDFPVVSFPSVAIFRYKPKGYDRERDMKVNSFGGFSALEPVMFTTSFSANVTLPTLVDPTPLTFGQLQELERLDPGHAQNVYEGYRMAANEQRDKKGAHFEDPQIIRMVVALPVGENYSTNLLPEVRFTSKDSKANKAWDPRLIVNGELNPSGQYLSKEGSSPIHPRIVMSLGGREGFMSIRRAQANTQPDNLPFPTPAHEKNKIAAIIFPYTLVRKPINSSLGSYRSYTDIPTKGSQDILDLSRGRGIVGGAQIGEGVQGMFSADKRDQNVFGDRYVPEQNGKPYIYSVKFLTISS